MKRILILVSLLAAIYLLAALLTQPAGKAANPGAQGPTPQDRELAALLRQLTNRSSQGLVQEKHPRGGFQLNLKGRFQNVALAKLNAQGKPVAGCVDSLAAANAFFGRNLETGQPLPTQSATLNETARQAALTGLSEHEYRFYQDLIAEAAQRRQLAPNSASIVISNGDGAGEGFNDTTPKAVEGGNNGATLGAQRLNLFNRAAAIWGAYLDSSIPTVVSAQFNSLSPCSPSGGTLGSTGVIFIHRDFPGAIFPGTWYHDALANKLSDEDRNAAADIFAQFNSDVDNGCLGVGTRFYYGFDNATPADRVNLLVVLLHELGHGLGFSTFVDGGSGALAAGLPDVYSRFMFDRDVNLTWDQMTDAQRQASALNSNDVLWDGPNVRIASGFLTAGRDAATGRVELYTPNPLENGSSISHWNTTATPNLLLEPIITPGLPLDLDLTRQLMRDLGWYRDTTADLTPDTITDVTPNSGSLTGGTNINLTWTNTGGFNRNVTIELSTNGGATFPTALATNVANSGARTVSLPNTPTAQARVRVREHNFVAPAGASSANFTIITGPNNLPMISAVGVSRQQGSAAGNSTIANVNDVDQALNTLVVTVNDGASATVNGVTVASISVNAAGVVTANVVAACTATTADFTLTVTDALMTTASATLTVTVTANSAPVLTYNNQALFTGATLNVNPASGPSDNGTVNSIAVQSPGTYTGAISVNNSTGVVTLSNAAPLGTHTITIRATDNCGATTDASFTLTVNNNLPQITAAAPLTRQQGSAGTVSTIATVSDVETAAGSLTVAATTVPPGLTVTGLTNTNGTITANVAAACGAALGANTVVLTVTDGNGGMATANLTVNVTANSAPTLTYNNQSVVTNGSLNISAATGPSDNGTVSDIVLQSQGTYSGTISVNNATGAIAISNAAPLGTHTIVIRATDNCGALTDASFTLIVGNNAPQITAGGIFARQQASPAGAAVQIATVSDVETPAGSLTVAATTVPPGITVSGITNTNGAITATLAAGCSAALGNNTVTLTVTDANSGTATATFTVNVTANTAPTLSYANQTVAAGGALTINPASAPSDNGTVNTIVVQSPGTYTGTIAVNNSTGVVSISNAKPGGVHTLTIRATDDCGAPTDATFTLTVICPTISLSPPSLPNGTVGASYNQTLTASGGTGPYTFSVSAGTLPTGLVLAAGGVLSGTPSAAGAFNFTVQAADANGCAGTRAYAVAINTLPTITAVAVSRQQGSPVANTTIANVTDLDQALNTLAVTVNGGTGAAVNGVTVSGLSVSAAGVVTANVVADCNAVTASFTLTVTDNATATATATLTVTVTANTAPTLTYNNQTVTAGGALNINAATGPSDNGAINTIAVQSQGTYTGAISVNALGVVSISNAAPVGTHTLTIRATDNCGAPTDAMFTLTVTPACPTITVNPANPTLPNGRAGTPYSQTFTQSGAATATFSVSAGALPNGLTLTGGGLLSGTPTVNGTFNFTIRATDANNCFGERAYTLLLNPPCTTITVNPATLPNGFQGTAYSQTLTATGGTAPHTFAVTAGALPNGLTLASGGALTGTPTVAGTFNFTITATDNTGCTGLRAYTVIISGNGLMFFPLPQPVRLLETRAGFTGCTMPGVPINANGTLTLPARTTCAGIPAVAAAVTGNITVVPSGPGFLTLFPSSATQPTVANSNFGAGEITNHVFTVGLGAGDGAFKIFSSAATHVIVDVTGYYAPPGTGGLYFHPLATPVRLLETRAGFTGCIAPGTQLIGTGNPNADPNLDLLLQGRAPVAAPCSSIPATAQVLVGNATSVLPTGGGYLTIYPSGGTRPAVASSNYAGGDVINGPFAVKLGADGKFKVYTFTTTHLVIDILGYYSEDATDANGAGLLFNPLPSPVRLLETRAGFAGCTMTGAPIAGNLNAATHTQMAANFCGLPASAQAVVGNVSVVNTTGAGFLTLFPANLTTAPLVATSNYPAPATFGYNRHFFVGLSPADGQFKVLTQFTTDLILDASGYFAP